jgi:hypothetical protein
MNEEKEKGKIDIFDIDRDEDLRWAVADLYSAEKHLSLTLAFLSEKLEEEPNNEYYKKLYEVVKNLLNGIRIERAKHLKRLEKFGEIGSWCTYKHLLGAMMQFAEVGAKDIYMGENDEIIKMDFKTSSFCRKAFILLNKLKKEEEHGIKRAD